MKQVPSSIINKPGTGKALATIADSLASKFSPDPSSRNEVETTIAQPKKIGLTIAFLVFGVFGAWSALAPIDSAAHAPGVVKVKSYNRVIQHLEGGRIQSINVQNGDSVKADDVLLVMDSTQAIAQQEILNDQLLNYSALEARLLAERDGLSSVVYPPMLLSAGLEGQTEMDAQNQIFNARKATQESTVAVLNQRADQLVSRITGLRAQFESKKSLANSYTEELEDFRSLLKDGFTDKQRLRQLERNLAQAAGEAAELTATIATTEIQIGEAKLQILQLKNEFQTGVANQLAEVQTRLKDTKERMTIVSDIVNRKEVRSPIDGIVTNLQIHTEGAVIGAGSTIAEIVPQSEALIVEATVMTTDIDRVAEGQRAKILFSAFNNRLLPNLYGTVMSISPDAMQDNRTGAHYYLARIELTHESVEDIQGYELVPGMPAEVFINTGSRTLIQYLMKPLTNAAARGLRED